MADDSPFICRLIKQYLESDPSIHVIKTVLNGKDAIEAVKTLRPDVLTLDINMPVLGGIETLERIMTECPTAVVMISGVSREAAAMTQKGISLGAVDFILKYSADAPIPPDTLRREIISKVKSAAKVKVIRFIPSIARRKGTNEKGEAGMVKAECPMMKQDIHHSDSPPLPPSIFQELSPPAPLSFPRTLPPAPLSFSKRGVGGVEMGGKGVSLRDGHSHHSLHPIVVIGASTGGPLALKELLSSLEDDFNFPIVIVQHMPERFTAILADQFNRLFPFPIKEAADGDILIQGHVLIAPGNRHLMISSDGKIRISKTPEIKGHRPSIDVAMQSAAHAFGDRVTGVILSGMGDDGAQGMLAINRNRGKTFAQSKETCVIDTMPASAIKNDSVYRVGSPAEIGRWIKEEV